MAIEYPAHVADIVRSMSENMAASVSLPPYVERPAIHGATLPNTPEEWCSQPLLVSSAPLHRFFFTHTIRFYVGFCLCRMFFLAMLSHVTR